MPKNYSLILLFFLFITTSSYSQKKTLQAKAISESISIDGKINEEAWKTAPIATDFIMFEPDNGKPISEDKKTNVKVLYDNTAIYISAIMYDNEPTKIQKELTNRDDFGASDHFSISINGFNDGQQDFRFFVSASGVQMDCIAREDYEDFSWDAIWDSNVTLTDYGWVVEMKIPYAALRFSKAPKQVWGLNFTREIKRDFQKYTWNYVDTKIGAVITQAGILEGIENIKTPTRLFLIPYTSAYYQQNDIGSGTTFKAGLDIKYGINDSFTLDAILIPDFGQTKFDNAILNLEPFEQRFDENRPFFTEGIDLFSTGGLLYSRRIGGFPSAEPQVGINEEVIKLPSSVDLINAIKISGRTDKGLGIGFLNAFTEKTFATILNLDTDETRKEVIEPFTNYNIIVLDQRFNQNSSFSFTNANTRRKGNFRDANATALVLDLNTKENKYNLFADFKYSTINNLNKDYDGFKGTLLFGKTRGKYRYQFGGKYFSENYDINDLGIIFRNNYHNVFLNGSYRIVNPTKVFNTFKIIQEFNLDIENTTGKTQDGTIKTAIETYLLNNNSFRFNLALKPIDSYDFYEPREIGSYVFIPKSISGYFGFLTDQTKPLSYGAEFSVTKFDENNRVSYLLNSEAKYRFNDKFSLAYLVQYTRRVNDRGWVDQDNTGIIFAERNREIVQHDFTGKYSINNKMTFNLTARYYWSYAENHSFLTLQNNGYLKENNLYSLNKNRNFNSWNFDLSYSWWIAPGSELSILYRNFAIDPTRVVEKNLGNNLKNVFANNLTNIFSISLRYYIDYNTLKNKL